MCSSAALPPKVRRWFLAPDHLAAPQLRAACCGYKANMPIILCEAYFYLNFLLCLVRLFECMVRHRKKASYVNYISMTEISDNVPCFFFPFLVPLISLFACLRWYVSCYTSMAQIEVKLFFVALQACSLF